MKRIWLFLVLLALIAPSALAQRAFQFRISVPAPTLGLGLEADLQRNLVAQLYGDIVLRSNVGFLLGGNLLFKPDLGQFDRDLRGISPYVGGGLGALLSSGGVDFGINLDLGIEFAIDRSTGIFIGGENLFSFNGGSYGRLIFGASFR
ncbi:MULTISPECIES: hypothetical protein [unclassified Meiothermus]|uniref:hypothetical protein n=1 Tax=unclassified Meiothermus TaxID=370471 RepID=UPI000D7CDF8B|nr:MULTISPECIES: hypothetical protein [unclassified Meiothermus]PZA07971.1 hypothetical protein DNA98_06665 [Meiothermus sp. Pnk-1]RYM35344.1 hypothetical protein EWH23_11630 [Meiothermus sp. PNK-Is4]